MHECTSTEVLSTESGENRSFCLRIPPWPYSATAQSLHNRTGGTASNRDGIWTFVDMRNGILENQEAASDLLYHYTKRSVALECILYERRLRFGRLADMNDPREYKDSSFVAIGEPSRFGPWNRPGYYLRLTKRLRDITKGTRK